MHRSPFQFRCPSLLAGFALALACTSDAPQSEATKGEATKGADPKGEASKREPARPTEPAPSKDPTQVATSLPITPAGAQASVLRPIALRKDPLALLRQHDAPLLVLDGEPLTFVDGAFVRHPVGSKGLRPMPPGSQDPALAAVSLDEPLGTWVTSGFDALRFGPKYVVHHREQAGWKRLPLGKGIILAYYAAYAERDGALLALQSWAVDPEEEAVYFQGPDELAERFPGKLARAEARAKQAWIRLAGAKVTALPEIPAGMRLDDGAITTADGTLWALATTPSSVVVDTDEVDSEELEEEEATEQAGGGEPPTTVLLMWPPGQVEPERIDVPDLAGAKDVALHDNGDWVIVAGATATESYLALGRGKEWQRVMVSLPADATIPSVHIQGAARLPDGELWIALGDRVDGSGSGQPVWRKPAEGAWQPVAVPEVRGEAFVTDEWERGWWGDWTRAQRQEGPVELGEASGLVWAAGSIWVVLGPIVDAGEPMDAPRHAVVLTTRPGDAPPAVLIPAWKQALEDQDHARTDAPGGPGCRDFTLVLGPGSLAGPAEGAAIPVFVGKIAKLEVERDPGDERRTIRSVYLAKLDGVSVVVAEATANSPKQVLALRDAAATIMAEEGVAAKHVVADCRIALVERMLHEPPARPQ